MEKIIEALFRNLMTQREEIIDTIRSLDPNTNGFLEKKMSLEIQVSNIDIQIAGHMATLERIENNKNQK